MDQVHPLPIIDERFDQFEKTITDEMLAEIQAMFTAYAERPRGRTLADTEHDPTRRLNRCSGGASRSGNEKTPS